MLKLVTTKPGPGNTALGLLTKVCKKLQPNSLHAAFAFISVSGVESFRAHFGWLVESPDIEKRIYAGIGRGLTEPEALRRMMKWPNTKVHVYLAGGKLSPQFILSGPLFHPKLLYVQSAEKNAGIFYGGSHNLTGAAFGLTAKNVEVGVFFDLGAAEAKFSEAVLSFLNSVNHESKLCTQKFLDQYVKLRLPLLQKNVLPLQDVEDEGDLIASAKFLFIEVGKGSGMDRHQVEFNEFIASYFRKPQSKRINLHLSGWKDRPLTPKTTTFGVKIYRLGMPTIRAGGQPIQNRAIRFERTNEPSKFNYDVTDIGSATWNKWMAEANKHGQIGMTSGGRRYGFGLV